MQHHKFNAAVDSSSDVRNLSDESGGGKRAHISTSTIRNLNRLSNLRAEFDKFMAAGNEVEAFQIAPNRPSDTQDFAFVGSTPQRKSQHRYYRCSFCETDRKFSAGKVVLSGDGLVRLIGPECWTKYFDENRHAEELQDLRNYELCTRFEERRQAICKGVSAAIPRVRTLAEASRSVLAFIDGFPSQIASDLTGFILLFQELRRSGGLLSVEHMVPDLKHGKNDDGSWKRFRPEQRIIHRVLGIDAVFAPPQNLPSLATEMLNDLFRIADAIPAISTSEKIDITAKAIQSLMRRFKRIEKNLETIKKSLAPA